MADSNEPVNRRAPVRKRFPTAADWKLKNEEGRARFTISRLMVLRNERISSSFSEEMDVHSSWRASTMSSHSARAASGVEARRWLKNVFMAAFSGSLPATSSGIRRTRRPVNC